jgi:hypothetical protein
MGLARSRRKPREALEKQVFRSTGETAGSPNRQVLRDGIR